VPLAMRPQQQASDPQPSARCDPAAGGAAASRPVTIFFANGGRVTIPRATSVQLREYSTGELNVICRNGPEEVAAFSSSHIVGWVIGERQIDGEAGLTEARPALVDAVTSEAELQRAQAIREAIGPDFVDDESRFLPVGVE